MREIAGKVDKVLKILSSISVIREAGFSSPSVRMLTARKEGPVTMKATFHEDPKSKTFTLTFTLEAGSQATPKDVLIGCRLLTEMKGEAPTFIPEDSDEVITMIGKRMSTILPPPPDYSIDDPNYSR